MAIPMAIPMVIPTAFMMITGIMDITITMGMEIDSIHTIATDIEDIIRTTAGL